MTEARRRQPREYLRAETLANVVIFVVALTLIAGLAISRSTDHLLSPGTVAAIVAIVGLVAGLTGRPIGLFEGAHAALLDNVDAPRGAASDDALAPRRLRRRSVGW